LRKYHLAKCIIITLNLVSESFRKSLQFPRRSIVRHAIYLFQESKWIFECLADIANITRSKFRLRMQNDAGILFREIEIFFNEKNVNWDFHSNECCNSRLILTNTMFNNAQVSIFLFVISLPFNKKFNRIN